MTSSTTNRFGRPFVLHGTEALVADTINLQGLYNAGAVFVFRFDGTQWKEHAKLTASDGTNGARFGSSIARWQDLLLIRAAGAPAVYSWELVGSDWIEQEKLDFIDTIFNTTDDLTMSIGEVSQGVGAVVGVPNGDVGHLFHYKGKHWTKTVTLATVDDVNLGGSFSFFDGRIAGTSSAGVHFYNNYEISCDKNSILLGCDPDCNENGVYDPCDVQFGTSEDCNGNDIPDECELPDCNGNGNLDLCDIFNGTSEDCDLNAIPDECEPDCNGSGSPDDCDIEDQTSEDCNANGVPDECDLADETSPDCNGNSVPDECDSASGTSEDCNLNGIPDECEPDCNGNNIADSCDIAAGEEDCGEFGNGIPDICEPDCNSNGISDRCETTIDPTTDCDRNDVLDECEGGPAYSEGCRRLSILPVGEVPGVSLISGNSIDVVAGSVVELHMLIPNWWEVGDGQLSRIYFKINGGSLANGVGDDLLPVGFAFPDGCPTSGDSCDEGGFIKVNQGVATGCDCTYFQCETPPTCVRNPDYVFRDFSPSVSVAQDTTDYEYRSVAFGIKADEGIEEYCGTLRLEIPPGAAGTYTIDLVDDPAVNFIWDGTGAVFPFGTITPATITIAVSGACCTGTSCSAIAEFHCASIGGTYLGDGSTCDQDDANGDGVPDGCDNIPGFATSPHHIPKNRFLSIDPRNDPAEPIALKVELLDRECSVTGRKCITSLDYRVCFSGEAMGAGCSVHPDCPGSLCALSGESCEQQSPPVLVGWVADPVLIAPDESGRIPPDTYHSLLVPSQLAPRVWIEEVVHIGDCEVAPANAYAISATADGNVFKSPLVIETVRKPQGKFWGDVVGNFDGIGWTAANGLVGVDDVTALIKFITLKPAPHITVVDLGGEVPNWLINATDLQLVLGAFKGDSYLPVAFTNQGGPADCP